MTSTIVKIACAAGFARDRRDAAGPLIDTLRTHPGPKYLVYENLAERTLAKVVVEREQQSSKGYLPSTETLVRPFLGACLQNGIRIIGNFGGVNPPAAAKMVKMWAAKDGFPDARVAFVTGDDLTDKMSLSDLRKAETDGALLGDKTEVLSVNAYLGARGIQQALEDGADIVVTGRVADPALFLGPLMHSHNWQETELDLLASGALAGHLLECGAQITGGYFADPGVKDVAGLDQLGYPIAEVTDKGSIVITKPDGTGGMVDLRTVKEQLLYEIHDPSHYITPDVILDMTQVALEQIGPDRVKVTGAQGRTKPELQKATVCFRGGYFAETAISYAGPNAAARARLAIDIIRKRLKALAPDFTVRADIVGLVSVFGDTSGNLLKHASGNGSGDVRVHFSTETPEKNLAELLLHEVEALYCTGPAGGGGVRGQIETRFKSASCLVARDLCDVKVHFCEALT